LGDRNIRGEKLAMRGQIFDDLQAHGGSMGQKAAEICAARRALQPGWLLSPKRPASRAASASMSNAPCPLWRRLVALVYDLLIVLAIVMVVGLLCQLATGGRLIETGARTVIPLWYQLLQGMVVAAYFVASWRRGGQTVGMRPWRIRVSRDDGGTISLQQAVIRVAVAAAPLLLLALEPAIGLRATLWTVLAAWTLWFAVALFDSRRRTLHDLAADTELRRMGGQ
jgi:uncharacterized RDD family membrane protein YckC